MLEFGTESESKAKACEFNKQATVGDDRRTDKKDLQCFFGNHFEFEEAGNGRFR